MRPTLVCKKSIRLVGIVFAMLLCEHDIRANEQFHLPRPADGWRHGGEWKLRFARKLMKSILVLLSYSVLTACQNASSRSQEPLSAGVLSDEYERSSAAVRSKYDGKEITVRGYALIAATMPQPGDDQGSVLLEEEKEPKLTRQVACWFSKDQAEQFSRIKGGQYVTVKGIFNGEAGADLKFCKLVKIE